MNLDPTSKLTYKPTSSPPARGLPNSGPGASAPGQHIGSQLPPEAPSRNAAPMLPWQLSEMPARPDSRWQGGGFSASPMQSLPGSMDIPRDLLTSSAPLPDNALSRSQTANVNEAASASSLPGSGNRAIPSLSPTEETTASSSTKPKEEKHGKRQTVATKEQIAEAVAALEHIPGVKKGKDYALKLKQVQPAFSAGQLSQTAHIALKTIYADPAFGFKSSLQAITPLEVGEVPSHDSQLRLAAAVAAVGECLPGERGTAYALRLHQYDNNLSPAELGRQTGVSSAYLLKSPLFKFPKIEAKKTTTVASITTEAPRLDNETDEDYASRLKTLMPRLSMALAVAASGATPSQLRRIPIFGIVTQEMLDATDALPERYSTETNSQYAQRIRDRLPDLNIVQYATLARVEYEQLRNSIAFQGVKVDRDRNTDASLDIQKIRNAVPRNEDEDETPAAYAARITAHIPNLSFAQLTVAAEAHRTTVVKHSKNHPEAWTYIPATQTKRTRPQIPPAAATIKQEPVDIIPLPQNELVTEYRDMASLRTRALIPLGDLTLDEGVTWETMLAPQAMVKHIPMSYDPAMDNVFPLRDPTDPLNRVAPAYAAPDGSVSPNTAVEKATAAVGSKSFFYELANKDPHPRLPRMKQADIAARLAEMSKDVHFEMDRLIKGLPQEFPRCTPRILKEDDVPAHEKKLVGQYGLFANPHPEGQRFDVSRGRILGLYTGVLFPDDEAAEKYEKTHPNSLAYAMDLGPIRPGKAQPKSMTSSGAANFVSFTNTALLPRTDEKAVPKYDNARINATFVEFVLDMRDKDGKPLKESVTALVALDSLYDDPNNLNRQVIADYGDEYLTQFVSSEVAADELASASSEPAPKRRKT